MSFGHQRYKPLGIAYADFPTRELAQKAIGELEGVLFKDRKLKVRFHVPYNPQPRFLRFSGSIKRAAPEQKPTDPVSETNEDPVPDNEPNAEPAKEIKFTPNSLFLKGLGHKVTVDRLREFLKLYNPTSIRIIRPKGFMKGLKSRAYNALVSFDIPAEFTIELLMDELNGKDFEGCQLTVMRAFRVEEKHQALEEAAPAGQEESHEPAEEENVAKSVNGDPEDEVPGVEKSNNEG